MHRLFDPLIDAAAGLGAGLDWKTSPAGAHRHRRARRPRVPDLPTTGPDHEKIFTAVVRVAGERPRLRHRPQQEGGRAGGRRRRVARAARAATRARSEAETDAGAARGRGGPARAAAARSAAAPSPSVEVLHPRAVRRHVPGADDFAARLTGRLLTRHGAPRQVPVAAARTPAGRAAASRAPRDERAAASCSRSAPDEVHLRVRLRFVDDGRELRFVDQRTFGGLSVDGARRRRACRHRSRTSRATRWTPRSTTTRSSSALRRRRTGIKRALLDQTLVSGIGNIYADEALWRAAAALCPRHRHADAGREAARLLGHVRDGDGRGAGGGRHVVRLAVRQRQRPERLLRPVAGRRTARSASRARGAGRRCAGTRS